MTMSGANRFIRSTLHTHLALTALAPTGGTINRLRCRRLITNGTKFGHVGEITAVEFIGYQATLETFQQLTLPAENVSESPDFIEYLGTVKPRSTIASIMRWRSSVMSSLLQVRGTFPTLKASSHDTITQAINPQKSGGCAFTHATASVV